MRLLRAALVGALVCGAVPAVAHDAQGPNGGRITDAGKYHAELVVRDNQIAVFLTDGSDKPVAPTGFKAVAIMTVGGKAERIALQPNDTNLSGAAPASLPRNIKGVVQITAPDGKVVVGQFK